MASRCQRQAHFDIEHTLVDFNNVLPDNASSTDVQVATSCQPVYRGVIESLGKWLYRENSPDLGVAHKSLLETDSETVCLKGNKVVLVTDSIHVLGVAVEDSVALLVVGQTPSIVDAAVWLEQF